MEQMNNIKMSLLNLIQTQLVDPRCVNAQELSEVFSMLKDLCEAAYYGSIVKAMEESKDEESMRYYSSSGGGSGSSGGGNSGSNSGGGSTNNYFSEPHYYYDSKMGGADNSTAAMYRRMYMTDRNSKDQNQSIQELNSYISELGNDLTDMIKNASPAEKQILSDKLAQLAMKVK